MCESYVVSVTVVTGRGLFAFAIVGAVLGSQ